jgi:hypothetical protein
MAPRSYLIAASVGGFLIGWGIGPAVFWPLIKLCFATLADQWARATPEELAGATAQFRIALAFLFAALPVCALSTERFAARAGYPQAIVKTAIFGVLAFSVALFYYHQRLAALQRIIQKMAGMFPPDHVPVALADNPLTKVLWITGISLLIFGPVDLAIGRWQARRRISKNGATPTRQEANKRASD